MLMAMAGIGVLCSLLISLTYEGTYNRIQQNKVEALKKAISNVLPVYDSIRSYGIDAANPAKLIPDIESDQVIYVGYGPSNQVVGIAIEAQGMGYADVIRILYGYDPIKEQIVGFQVLESKETPGLGDAIEKNKKFLKNFESLDVALSDGKDRLRNEVVPVKNGTKNHPWEVDCITGATISSRAVGEMINESASFWLPILQRNQKVYNPLTHGNGQ